MGAHCFASLQHRLLHQRAFIACVHACISDIERGGEREERERSLTQ